MDNNDRELLKRSVTKRWCIELPCYITVFNKAVTREEAIEKAEKRVNARGAKAIEISIADDLIGPITAYSRQEVK
jgi:hypothetical protein